MRRKNTPPEGIPDQQSIFLPRSPSLDYTENMKKIVVMGGGTGLSCLLTGLKLFPLDVTTVISVADNGSSTGVLKEELNIPAVGDVGKVLLAMANVDEDFVSLLRYRFKKNGSLYNHPVRNILLAALIDLKGNLTDATEYLSRILNVKGKVLPLTEEKVELVGKSIDGDYYGQEEVSRHAHSIRRLTYDHDIHVSREVCARIREADLVIFSPGSLYTSILPHLLAEQVLDALDETKAPLMYISNLVTQPGETDHFSLGDHLAVLNQYLRNRKIDLAIANNSEIDDQVRRIYLERENKTIVNVDRDVIRDMGCRLIEDDIFCVQNGSIRHSALKTAYLVFSYLMEGES